GLSISESDFLTMWKAFNYGYILIYPKEKKEVVEAVLAREYDENVAYQNVLKRAEAELKQNPDDIFAQFNIAVAEYYLGNYEEAVAAFEKAEPGLPPRMLWYQYEPILAYQKVKNYDRVFQLTDVIFNSGNVVFSELYQIRGEVYMSLGDKEAARAAFEKAAYYNHNFLAAKKALENIN
ncbi:MAG: tetratricopeptide repeat protein, partial [Candidatus Levybacteria bacterium]|nr:tetratricopeptide repeat protein [Candidatus Levybacteria bacterium]